MCIRARYGSDACQGMVLVPFKCNFDESDLTTDEYNLDGLLDYPVPVSYTHLDVYKRQPRGGPRHGRR